MHTRNLLAGLQGDGHHVTLVIPVAQRSPAIPKDVQLITVSSPHLQSSAARWIELATHFSRALRRANATKQFDIVHFTDAREAMLFAGQHPAVVGNVNDYYAADLRPLSYYRTHYSDAWQRWLYYALVHQSERSTFRRLNAIVANSDFTRNAVKSAYDLNEQTLFKCFKCIDLSLFDDALQTSQSENLVLFAGGNMQRKGLRTLILAAPQILNARPDTKFKVIGTDSNRPYLQSLCNKLGVANHFQFLGGVSNEELRTLYRQATVFVMPSLMEAFGVVLLEAMASGTPVIATRVGGIPELINSGDNGFLVEPEKPEQFANALIEVLANPNLARRLGERGKETARNFGIEPMLACTYRIYETILGESR